MSYTIPNEADAFNPNQAEPDKVDIDILVAGISGDGVLSGCAVTAQGTPDMTLAVASGQVKIGTATPSVASGNVTVTAAHATDPRCDLVVVDDTGAKSVVVGMAAAEPVFPAVPANSVVLAAIYVPANDTAIQSNQITDKRVGLAVPAHEGAANPHPTYETSAEAQAKVDAHAAAGDPHPTYLTQAEGDGLYEGTGAVAAHEAAGDPHPTYLTSAEGDTKITNHEAAANPHPSYETSAEAQAKVDTHAAIDKSTAHPGTIDTADIADDQVTYAKMQNISAASKLLGRGDSGAGDVQEITLGANLSMSGTTLAAGGGGAPTDADYLVATAQGGLSNEIVVGASPGGELGGTWADPTVDATHSGSAHTDFIAKSIVDAKGDLIVATGADAVARVAVGADDSIPMADAAQSAGIKWVAAGTPVLPAEVFNAGTADTFARGDHTHETLYKVKTADEIVNNSTALQDDNHLVFGIGASATEIWLVELFILATAASTTMDGKLAWTVPSGATMRWARVGGTDASAAPNWVATGTSTAPTAFDIDTSVRLFGSQSGATGWGMAYAALVFGGGTSGNIQLQWAQNTQEVADLTFKKGSFLRATRLVA